MTAIPALPIRAALVAMALLAAVSTIGATRPPPDSAVAVRYDRRDARTVRILPSAPRGGPPTSLATIRPMFAAINGKENRG